jgi:hypothetical protein
MRPVAFGEALSAGARLTPFLRRQARPLLYRHQIWMDATSGVALDLKTGVPFQVEDGLPRRRLAGGGRKAELTY